MAAARQLRESGWLRPERPDRGPQHGDGPEVPRDRQRRRSDPQHRLPYPADTGQLIIPPTRSGDDAGAGGVSGGDEPACASTEVSDSSRWRRPSPRPWPPAPHPRRAGRAPKSGSTNASLTADLASYPASLDPGLQYDTDSYSVYRNIFDQLLHRDPSTHQIVPWLATSWKQTDPKTWVFTMRPGREVQRRHPDDGGRRRLQHPAHPGPEAGQPAERQLLRDRLRDRFGQHADHHHQVPVPDAALLPHHAVGRADGGREEGRRREVQPAPGRIRPLRLQLLHPRLPGGPEAQRRLVGPEAADRRASPSARCPPPPAGSPTSSPARPTSPTP